MADGVGEPGAGPATHRHYGIDDLRALEEHLIALVHHKRAGRDVNQLHDESLTFGERVADAVAATMGSWRFIIVQSLILAAWIVLNVAAWVQQWDPYPFILLNLMLSFQAAYSAPIIMMSQNRQEDRDRIRAELDLQTDLKAETLIEELHLHVDELRLQQWSELLAIQQQQIAMLTGLVAQLSEQARHPSTDQTS